MVLPFQNGVDAASQLLAVLGRGPVIGGLCKIVSFIDGPGHIRHVGFEPFVAFGELDNHQSERVQELHRVFVNAGLNTVIPADINVALWNKFLFISAFSGIGALTGNAAGKIRSDEQIRGKLQKAMEEVYALAQARGIGLPANAVATTMASVDGLPEDATSSMQRDIAAGRPSELESQTGTILRLAHESGIPVPTHELIYDALKPLETKARAHATTP
jgi:2-dehydropantoate 2-reductase